MHRAAMYREIRKKYPKFIYKSYSWKISENNLEIFFDFQIEPDINFRPKVKIENINKQRVAEIGDRVLNNLVFNLGLAEIPSYWKATCAPEIEIKAGHLDKKQVEWWKHLIMNGMGQFFFENKIDFRGKNFLKIISKTKKSETQIPDLKLKGEILAPLGGGKDSIVTLEILKNGNENTECFALNPTATSLKVMKAGECQNPIIVRRTMDEKLLELNRRGFLNGHTPFSSYLAFLSFLLSAVFDKKYIALSNERSSNEGNAIYLGKTINHQYSKSFDFEERFRDYSKKYLLKDAEYFSFLRPLYELQIAKLFSNYQLYFPVFLSCNEAYKTDSGKKTPEGKWCCKCSKCLFAFAILYPFLGEKTIGIFGNNLFENKSLLPIMEELIGERDIKPFECVGTRKESLIAFYLSLKKNAKPAPAKLPFLLEYFNEKILPKYPRMEKDSERLLNSWNRRHNLPEKFEKILKNSLKTA